jgi:hypothetical protein
MALCQVRNKAEDKRNRTQHKPWVIWWHREQLAIETQEFYTDGTAGYSHILGYCFESLSLWGKRYGLRVVMVVVVVVVVMS